MAEGRVLKPPTRPPKGQRRPKTDAEAATSHEPPPPQPIAEQAPGVTTTAAAPTPTIAAPPPPRAVAAAPTAKPRAARPARPAATSRRKFPIDAFSVPAWLAFTTGMVALLGLTQRFLFPNVLYEPPTTFKAGFPGDYTMGEFSQKFKDLYRVWIVREATGFFALYAKCTHLGCTPNWMETEDKIKCPCHGSGYYRSGINFEGPTPRPLERVKISLADDGQILVDTSVHYQYELGQWNNPGSYLKV